MQPELPPQGRTPWWGSCGLRARRCARRVTLWSGHSTRWVLGGLRCCLLVWGKGALHAGASTAPGGCFGSRHLALVHTEIRFAQAPQS